MSIFRRAADCAYDATFRIWASPVLLADGRRAWHISGNLDEATVELVDGGETERVPLYSLTHVAAADAASWPAHPFPHGGAS